MLLVFFFLASRKNLAVTICSPKNAGGGWSLEQYIKTADLGSDGLQLESCTNRAASSMSSFHIPVNVSGGGLGKTAHLKAPIQSKACLQNSS